MSDFFCLFCRISLLLVGLSKTNMCLYKNGMGHRSEIDLSLIEILA